MKKKTICNSIIIIKSFAVFNDRTNNFEKLTKKQFGFYMDLLNLIDKPKYALAE